MGIIKAIAGAIGGGLADQWLEVLEPNDMSDTTVFTTGVTVRQGDRRSSNTKGTEDTVSNGSIIHVYDNQFMMLVDGGKVVDYTAEPGYYKVDHSSLPSLFSGKLGETVKETFSRFKYGGVPSSKQKVFFINLQEIKGIKFGTRNPVNYFDNFYNSELFLRAFGTYSIKITDPIKFYQEAVPRNAGRVDITEINEQYLNEFLEGLAAAVNRLSADGERISFVVSKGRELSKYMSEALDEEWKQRRGMEVLSVGIGSISYDEESQKLINMRNQGAMLGDPGVREGYVQGSIARGIEAAGSNSAGSMAGFVGVGVGLQGAGGVGAAFSQANQTQLHNAAEKSAPQETATWKCACGQANKADAKFCAECGAKKPETASWKCSCGKENEQNAKFCPSCGAKRPEANACKKCGHALEQNAKFCPDCGEKQ
ncbi:MAG TPA: SPFH domain-containing protein [Clostridia bacterium]|nr:SPFH domain-containing protein [Clostridia bacterium]